MKTLIALFLVTFAMNSNASLQLPTVGTPMTLSWIDENSPLAQYDIQWASMNVDLDASTITLTLDIGMPQCQSGLACVQVMPEPIQLTLENVEVSQDQCGIITYSATLDNTTVDGLVTTLSLKNNSNNNCPTFNALPRFEGSYDTYSVRTLVETRAHFISIDPVFFNHEQVILPVEPLESY